MLLHHIRIFSIIQGERLKKFLHRKGSRKHESIK
jgi:hypothetical protein